MECPTRFEDFNYSSNLSKIKKHKIIILEPHNRFFSFHLIDYLETLGSSNSPIHYSGQHMIT